MRQARLFILTPTIALLLAAACGDGSSSSSSSSSSGGSSSSSGTASSTSSSGGTAGPFAVGGNVTGLTGTGLVLTNNGGDDRSVSAAGAFTFATKVAAGGAYAVAVKTQPTSPKQTCSVANGMGTVSADVSNVGVTCATDTFLVKGTLTGLTGGSVVLQNNMGDDLTVSATGAFSFMTKVADGGAYAVTVKTQPMTTPPQTCTVATGTGTIAGADANTATVTCAPSRFQVGGTVTGLAASPVVLQNNLGDDLTVSANGSFNFMTKLLPTTAYSVTQKTRPTGKDCSITNATGTVGTTDVANVTVVCADAPYYVLTGTPPHTTVFNTIAETYKFGNNLTNSIWHRRSNLIITGEFTQNGYWSFAQATNNYVAAPNNDTTSTYTRLVQIPATNTVVFSKAGSTDGVGPGTAANVVVATIDATTGALSGRAAAVFSDGFSGACSIHSSSATEFFCLSSATVIKRYRTNAGSPNLTYVADITLSQALPAAALCTGVAGGCYGSTFAYDGAYFYFATSQNSSNNLKYEVYTATGTFVAQDTATGSGSINGTYFDWSVGRYSTHDGFGGRTGATSYTAVGGVSDTHNFSAIDTVAHALP